jgi:hypothetical protein
MRCQIRIISFVCLYQIRYGTVPYVLKLMDPDAMYEVYSVPVCTVLWLHFKGYERKVRKKERLRYLSSSEHTTLYNICSHNEIRLSYVNTKGW